MSHWKVLLLLEDGSHSEQEIEVKGLLDHPDPVLMLAIIRDPLCAPLSVTRIEEGL
jgi:hypothetical protein